MTKVEVVENGSQNPTSHSQKEFANQLRSPWRSIIRLQADYLLKYDKPRHDYFQF